MAEMGRALTLLIRAVRHLLLTPELAPPRWCELCRCVILSEQGSVPAFGQVVRDGEHQVGLLLVVVSIDGRRFGGLCRACITRVETIHKIPAASPAATPRAEG
jgi:hypothetical protein